jgi:hypothetical protein
MNDGAFSPSVCNQEHGEVELVHLYGNASCRPSAFGSLPIRQINRWSVHVLAPLRCKLMAAHSQCSHATMPHTHVTITMQGIRTSALCPARSSGRASMSSHVTWFRRRRPPRRHWGGAVRGLAMGSAVTHVKRPVRPLREESRSGRSLSSSRSAAGELPSCARSSAAHLPPWVCR